MTDDDAHDLFQRFQTGAGTHKGCVRTANEDHFLAAPELGIWVVSDGMGGHVGGAFASAAIVSALDGAPPAQSVGGLLDACNAALARANERIRAHAAESGATVGATVAALLAFDKRYACVWCGDSRVYLIRKGEIRQISRDHSEVQELVDSGAITADQARTWPGRNVLTRAVGIASQVLTDTVEGDLEEDDIFLLCSDGLTGHVSDEEIRQIVLKNSAASARRELIDLALERGGKDNVTVIVVHYRPDPTRPPRRADDEENWKWAWPLPR